jgi:hypothetical protein
LSLSSSLFSLRRVPRRYHLSTVVTKCGQPPPLTRPFTYDKGNHLELLSLYHKLSLSSQHQHQSLMHPPITPPLVNNKTNWPLLPYQVILFYLLFLFLLPSSWCKLLHAGNEINYHGCWTRPATMEALG